MNDAAFARLAAIVYEQTGIHFHQDKRYILDARLAPRLD